MVLVELVIRLIRFHQISFNETRYCEIICKDDSRLQMCMCVSVFVRERICHYRLRTQSGLLSHGLLHFFFAFPSFKPCDTMFAGTVKDISSVHSLVIIE